MNIILKIKFMAEFGTSPLLFGYEIMFFRGNYRQKTEKVRLMMDLTTEYARF